MRAFVLAAISAYQRYLSPRKGFCCAYRAHTGRKSCSTLGFRAVRRYGVVLGLTVLRRRLYLCGVAHRRYAVPCRRPLRSQRGDCDVGCDLPVDAISCCDAGSCDWPDLHQTRKRNDSERHMHIPPHAGIRKCSGRSPSS